MPSQTAVERIKPVAIETEMRRSYIKYAMSVIVRRAIPDVRDGLKPVQRRILYAMHEMGINHQSPHKKSARIVGEVLGKLHPHGDAAVYDALVRMTQDFSVRYTLIDGQGNFGSVDGDEPAAMRYTEVRLSKISGEILADLEAATVDWTPNFDESIQEPTILPSKLPNLLVNGSSGIAVGMSCNVPPHNLSEVVDAITHLLKTPQCIVEDLMVHVKGPDFPTGGIIYDRSGIVEAYKTGRGLIRIYGKIELESVRKDRQRIVITEIPYQVVKANIVQQIAREAEGAIEGIVSVRDESNREGIRIVVELKPGANPEIVKSQLYKRTQLQETFGYINLVLVERKPRILDFKQTLQAYIDHRADMIERRSKHELEKASERSEILKGYKIIADHITEIVESLKTASSRDEVISVFKRYELTETQIEASLEMKLHQLSGFERGRIDAELEKLSKRIEWLKTVIGNRTKIYEIITEELELLKRSYGDARRTTISATPLTMISEEEIPDQTVMLPFTEHGYVKRLAVDSVSGRGSRGITLLDLKEGDSLRSCVFVNSREQVGLVTSEGRFYLLKAYRVPETTRGSRGTPIANLLDKRESEKTATILAFPPNPDKNFMILVTRQGLTKRMRLEDLITARAGGVICATLDEGDLIRDAKITSGNDPIFIATTKGMIITYPEDDISTVGRTAKGVVGIRLDPGDHVQSLEAVSSKNATDLLTVTQLGYGKLTPIEEYRQQHRGGRGLISIKTSQKNGNLADIRAVRQDEEVYLATSSGRLFAKTVSEIQRGGRNTLGRRILRLDQGETVTSIIRASAN